MKKILLYVVGAIVALVVVVALFAPSETETSEPVAKTETTPLVSASQVVEETDSAVLQEACDLLKKYPDDSNLFAGFKEGYDTDTTGFPPAEDVWTEIKAHCSETKPQAKKAAPKPTKPVETPGQENARESAEDYLSSPPLAFSRKGLIEQLEFEGYSTKDATYAVDNVTVNWNEQAAQEARNYLDSGSFSRSGLIEQLEYEGFTRAQATYGVNQAGL